ncbi:MULTISPECIES: type III polyketide synthase [Pontibacillus]|uniref:3-oxoacyl-[acyl-carrier-protein] synthase III C-terminal domain-containing protein n=1 Tax=Pontibacillus chungwhensis TaxID=265426 RepID=A0ABY8UU95_9BACI|nr:MULTISPECIES: 3-oxoacyl-[acyl-carrier-protein] synthase III C-terminal domain-containing protein [Pontibacillus]MCD5322937.1 type III polyketide synthase [Pontibacillus sp. HN14]WIF96331.1 3-oxoacyl-[acyl-carrier-protein] synthase III C-terminal domain-containing protein [Pontibacillus chungwhensis]
MAWITSVGVSIPEYEIAQRDIQSFVKEVFPRSEREITRLLPVFENAAVDKRQFVVPKEWFGQPHTFQERNELYEEKALSYSLEAIDDCLKNKTFLQEPVPYEAIDYIIYVSSTGVATPTIDARIMNEREFREDVKRVPLWGLGCAGGGAGLARAMDFAHLYPESNILVVCVELCGLTFQKNDRRKSNFIGTALFGDGIAAALVVGEKSPYASNRISTAPQMNQSSSKLKKHALDVMGWNVNEDGFQVVFAKSIPVLVETFWKGHVEQFLSTIHKKESDLSFFVAHPGGQKVLQAYQEVLNSSEKKFSHSYEVLKQHGNMSSATVIHVLKRWMEEFPKEGTASILAALGPGFSSELVSLEWLK